MVPSYLELSAKHMCEWHTNLLHSFLQYVIPSTPGDLFSFMLLILLATTSGVTINCSDISDLGPLNFVTGVGNDLVSSLVNT